MAAQDRKISLHFQRFEFKYQLPLVMVEGLIPEFLKYLEIDPYAVDLPDNYYHVNSLYYDSLGLGCYYEKLAGIEKRKKLRVRFYDDNFDGQTPIFLEIKGKHGAVVIKDRVKLNYSQAKNILINNQLSIGELPAGEAQTLNRFLWIKLRNGMIPKVMVKYKRKPFISKLNPDFRVTIDYDLKAYAADWINEPQAGKEICPQMAVLELKFNNSLPDWFHRIIQRYNLEQKPFSKYCNSLEAISPEFINDYPTFFNRELLVY